MLKVVILVALALGSTATDIEKVSGSNITAFITGVVTGLGNGSPSVCGQSVSTLINDGFKVISDFENPDKSLQATINTLNDMQSLVNALGTVGKCDISQLDNQLAKIFAKGGWKILVNNYLENGAAIFTDYHTIAMCHTNYNACGVAVGNAFKLLVGWTLN